MKAFKFRTDKTQPIVIEKKYQVSLQLVWEALTVAKEMKRWYFDISGFKAEPDFEFSFKGGTEKHEYIHLCKITEVVQKEKISYTWKYKGIPGNTLVTFELVAEGSETTVKLTHSGLETFPANNPDLQWNSFYEGWSYILGTSLPDYLKSVDR